MQPTNASQLLPPKPFPLVHHPWDDGKCWTNHLHQQSTRKYGGRKYTLSACSMWYIPSLCIHEGGWRIWRVKQTRMRRSLLDKGWVKRMRGTDHLDHDIHMVPYHYVRIVTILLEWVGYARGMIWAHTVIGYTNSGNILDRTKVSSSRPTLNFALSSRFTLLMFPRLMVEATSRIKFSKPGTDIDRFLAKSGFELMAVLKCPVPWAHHAV